MKRGRKKAVLVDYYSEGESEVEIEIELAPEKTPRQNMELFFKRAAKFRRGRPRIENEMEAAKEYLAELEKLKNRIEALSDLEKIGELDTLTEKRLAPRRPKKAKGVPAAKLGPKKFISSDGYEIFVGRNQRQNDRLTLTIARGNDIFMHSAGSPGSHVIIRMKEQPQAPEKTMKEAAQLALYYSKLRNNKYAEVSWTNVKNVSKPRHAKPGLVYLSKHKVMGIEPDEKTVKMLHDNAVVL